MTSKPMPMAPANIRKNSFSRRRRAFCMDSLSTPYNGKNKNNAANDEEQRHETEEQDPEQRVRLSQIGEYIENH
jgi:hypothetical protein